MVDPIKDRANQRTSDQPRNRSQKRYLAHQHNVCIDLGKDFLVLGFDIWKLIRKSLLCKRVPWRVHIL